MNITFTTTLSAAQAALTRAALVSATSDAGRKSTATLKVPGVDTLPAGATWTGTRITVTGDNVLLEDWSIPQIDGTGLNLTVRDCVLTDSGLSGTNYLINPGAAGWTVEDCTIQGPNNQNGSGTLILSNHADFTARRNTFSKFANDGIKNGGTNALIELNVFKDPSPYPASWDNTLAYSAGDFTLYGTQSVYKANADTVAGEEPGVSSKWTALDPHVDLISCSGGSGTVRYNYFPEILYSFAGPTQQIRLVRDTRSAADHGPFEVYGNVFEQWNGNYSHAVGAVRDFEAGTYQIGQFAGAGNVYYRATTTTSTNPAVDATDWAEDRDLGTVGDILFAYNWMEHVGSGIFNGVQHRLTFGTNYDSAGAEFSPAPGAIVDDIPAPAMGDDLAYTTPVKYGPSQKFTITPSAYGSVFLGGVEYTNACAVRAGIQIVAILRRIDGVTYWRTMQDSGVTVEDVGGGAFILRIYDSAGNPMQATVDIPSGAATVAVETDEVATNTATPWGNHLAQSNYVDTTNLVPDGSFDDATNQSSWENTTDWANFGVVAGGLLQIKPTGSGSVYSVPANNAPTLTENTTYHVLFDVTRLDHADTSKRLRIELDGTRTPSTYAPSAVGTHGPWTYTTGAGQTTARIRIQVIDTGFDMDISDFIIRPA